MTFASPTADGYYAREEFRRWYDAQPEGRYERVDSQIVAMVSERGAHLRIKGAVYIEHSTARWPSLGCAVKLYPMAGRWKPATATTNRMHW